MVVMVVSVRGGIGQTWVRLLADIWTLEEGGLWVEGQDCRYLSLTRLEALPHEWTQLTSVDVDPYPPARAYASAAALHPSDGHDTRGNIAQCGYPRDALVLDAKGMSETHHKAACPRETCSHLQQRD